MSAARPGEGRDRLGPPHTVCQWIAGETGFDDRCKCGRPVVRGEAWCPEHLARVYLPRGQDAAPASPEPGAARPHCGLIPGPGLSRMPTRNHGMGAGMPVDIAFVRDMTFEYGVAGQVSPLIRRVIARNPGAFTFHGTGTYIVGRDRVAVIDPGPDLPEHLDALTSALGDEQVSHILITHTHRDHSPAAEPLKRATGAPTYGFGPHGSGRPEAGGEVEEGADHDFAPDVTIRDGERIAGEGWTFEAVHTPGHTSNHLCFALAEERVLFSGDHVMGWSTSVISPPDGDMQAYMRSLRRLLDRDDQVYWPTHGPPITAPRALVADFIAHREDRERQITACLAEGRATIPEMVDLMYAEVPRHLHPAAAHSVLAHLVHMVETRRVACEGPPRPDTIYALADDPAAQ